MLAVPPRYHCDPITAEPSTAHNYDGQGRETRIERPAPPGSYDASVITIAYDALGRRASETQDGRAVRWQYDLAGRPTRLTWPDNVYVTYDYSPAAQLTAIRDSGGAALIEYQYDGFGRMTRLERANGLTSVFSFDPVARLSRLHHQQLVYTDFTYNPASQILTRAISNGNWAWDEAMNVNLTYDVNNLNQYTEVGPTDPSTGSGQAFAYDPTGNLTDDGPYGYAYDPENRMKWSIRSPTQTVQLRYDGRGRLRRRTGAGASGYLYDGDALIEEHNFTTGVVQRRYIHGAGMDDPLIWYEGSGTTDRRFLHADERGSITTVTDSAGGIIARNTYDDWGVPGAGNIGRFQYTGQQWLPELGLYYYKARFYGPGIGRFWQTDPVGYESGMNLYAYVGNDPVSFVDPAGMDRCAFKTCGTLGIEGMEASSELALLAASQPRQPRPEAAHTALARANRAARNVTQGRQRPSARESPDFLQLTPELTISSGVASDNYRLGPGINQLIVRTYTHNFVQPQMGDRAGIPIPFGSVSIRFTTQSRGRNRFGGFPVISIQQAFTFTGRFRTTTIPVPIGASHFDVRGHVSTPPDTTVRVYAPW